MNRFQRIGTLAAALVLAFASFAVAQDNKTIDSGAMRINAYDVTVLYNTVGSGTAGPTVITYNGRTVVNGVSDAPGNLESYDGRINVGGSQILIGVSSPSGTAALNGVIITPVVQ